MAEDDDLRLPLEVPWKLASTTQVLTGGEPDQTSISLFFHEPDDDQLTSKFPDEKLVYLKFTVSVSPATLPAGNPPLASRLGEGVPCYHLLLDLKVRNGAGNSGTIRPYFHSAAPLNRRMIQSGVVGVEVFEGESEGQFFGKSGSQMYESLSSQSRTTSFGGGAAFALGPLSIGGSARTSSTSVTSGRAVSQSLDTTTREASDERRQLISHMTKVENVLTLLNAKYVGTPYLSFSLSPPPLSSLAVDPSDPSLWYSQLLQRRSSGIEGIQEFTAVVVVPRDQEFCVTARLRRVCLLDDPPESPDFNERFNLQKHVGRALDYIESIYPVGTPLDELDPDITGRLKLPPNDQVPDFVSPVVEGWVVAPFFLSLNVISPQPSGFAPSRATLAYKSWLEVWVETLRFEYEKELRRSPLERGILLGENRLLDTCFSLKNKNFIVGKSSASVSPLVRLLLDKNDFIDPGVLESSVNASARARAVESVTHWNALEQRLKTRLDNRREIPNKPLTFDDPGVLRVLVESWAKISPDDERNLDFKKAVTALNLSESHRKLLKDAGATDLKSIALVLKAAPVIERYNEQVRLLRQTLRSERAKQTPPELITQALSVKDSAEIRNAIGAELQKSASENPPRV